MTALTQICIVVLVVTVSAGQGYPQRYQDTRQQGYQPLVGQSFQLTPASTSLLPNNVNNGVRYSAQGGVVFLMPDQQLQQQQQPLQQQQQYFSPQQAFLQPQTAELSAEDQYLESLLAANYPAAAVAAGGGAVVRPHYYQPSQQAQRPVSSFLQLYQPQRQSDRVEESVGVKYQQEDQSVEIQRLQDAAADQQKYAALQQFYQMRPNANFLFYSLPQQQQQQVGSRRGQHHGLRPSGLSLVGSPLKLRSGQEQNNASSEVGAGQQPQETAETTQSPQEEVGPSIAQAKPQAISIAGPGGVAAAAPVGTAVVGPGGMALSAPTATALAGTKQKPGGHPSGSAKLRQAISYLY